MLDLGPSPAESPDELVRRLTQLQLCRPADFRKARARVRRLARDLPTFDSVWIDALVQLRKLSPFQARALEAGNDNQLVIDRYVVLDELGHGPHGTTYLAKAPGWQDRVILKQLQIPVESIPECRGRLMQFLERSQGWSHPHLVVPHTLVPGTEPQLVTVSRLVAGLTLGELLVRRGRLPADVVIEIARQLGSGLAALHGRGLVHGDIRLSNVRLTNAGSSVLVDGGIRPAVCPELTIHETLALEAYDSIAPELIGTGITPNASSEIYALGCLLWQLLTGRPPYSMADSLMKLAAHQTQRIPDCRTLAPDTPAAFAETLFAMTSPDVNERPRSLDELLQRWGRPRSQSRSRLKRYRRHFDGAVPHFVHPGEPVTDSRWPWIAVSLFVAAGIAFTLADKGLQNELLAMSHRVRDAIQSRVSDTNPTNSPTMAVAQEAPTRPVRTANGLLPLPAVSSGEIVLTDEGPYDVRDIPDQGNLTIRGARGITPIIQIGRDSLRLAGKLVRLENIAFASDSSNGPNPEALVLIKSNQLEIDGCSFVPTLAAQDTADAPPSPPHSPGRRATSLAWSPSDTLSDQCRIELRNTVFRTESVAIWSTDLPYQVNVTNCLKTGSGAFFAVFNKATVHPVSFQLSNLTLRETGPLLRLAGAYAEQADSPMIELAGRDCVFSIARKGDGLIELQTARPRTDAAHVVHLTGSGSVMAPNVAPVVIVDPARRSSVTVPEALDQFEGIAFSNLKFQGPTSGPTANSWLEKQDAPRSSADGHPGIDPQTLPSVVVKRRTEDLLSER
ncbi:MAG: serine/threonine protein kinase [Planctomycetes bacterium]|nr:serine/threonine protein kinase [Planctomycetota bacterium]